MMIRLTKLAFMITLVWAAGAAGAQELRLPDGFDGVPASRDYTRLLQAVAKPAVRSGVTGDDSCRFANDGECDEPGFGTGACAPGTDYSDCWRIMTGQEDDSCQWANDGECDEPGFGTGACTQGTDRSDCGDVSHLRFRDDSCEHAFNGVCDEPEIGTGLCAARTDRSDCVGRERPLTINDHFFGFDDRVLKDTGEFPWSVIGQVTFESGGGCTATLIGPDILVTAAHCISSNNRIRPEGRFETGADLPGGPRTARITDFLMGEEWNEARFSGGIDYDGTDWALLRIDTPLGGELGYVSVRDLTPAQSGEALRARIWQAGYSWDTGENLSGNEDCRILEIHDGNTMAHDCDTTRGDSGSPFMIEENGRWYVVATDSNFRSNPDGPFIYIAALSSRWAGLVEDFAVGRIGNGGLRLRGPGKPGAPEPLKK